MNDDELGWSLERSVERRVGTLTPRPDVEELLVRIDRKAARRRGFLVAAVIGALFVGGFVGHLIAPSRGGSSTPGTVSAFGAGGPGPPVSGPSFEPRDADAARGAVANAFHDAFNGGVPNRTRDAAVQDAAALHPLRRDVSQFAQSHGYTTQQLAGTTVSVLETSFIDPTHAVVRFSLTIPGHGAVLVDRVGYAILERGRWRVSLRTSCDLLSITGLRRPCPTNP